MKNKNNNCFAALEALKHIKCHFSLKAYILRPEEKEEFSKRVEIIDKTLTRLSAIEPLLLELIEARGKATDGEWSDDGRCIYDEFEEIGCMGEFEGHDAPFVTLSANNIAKIKEIMEKK